MSNDVGPNWVDRRLRRLQGPDRPWTILLQAHLREPVAHAEIERAWRAVVTARPEVHVSPAPDGGWVATSTAPRVSIGPLEPALDRARHDPDDSAVSVIVEADPAMTVSMVVDHSLTDGLGARAMLADLLRALQGAEVSPRSPVTDAALDRLCSRRLGLRAALAQIPPRRVATLGAMGATTRLASATVDLAGIHERRRASEASVGAVVIEATLETLRARRTDSPKGTSVAVGVPADLRRHMGDPTGVGNAVVNLTITDRRASSLAAIDAQISEQTTRRRLGETLSWVKRATRPGPPRTSPRDGRLVASAMLSNLGALGHEPAWGLVDRVAFAPPAHQTVSIGVVGHRRDLTVTVRSRLLDPDATAALASELAERLR